jgi:hypothetical protein
MADKLELDTQTGLVIERDYTTDESAQRTKDLAKHAALAQAEANRKARKAEVIAKLGLTADEATALLS